MGQTTPEESISLIAECINRAHEATRHVIVVLENMVCVHHLLSFDTSQVNIVHYRLEQGM